MEIIKMVSISDDRWKILSPYLTDHLSSLQTHGFSHSFVHTDDGYTLLMCKKHPSHLSIQDILDLYYYSFSSALTEYIVEEFEEEYIHYLLTHDFGFSKADDRNQIFPYCYRALFLSEEKDLRDEWKISERKIKILQIVLEYLRSVDEVNVEGFIRFRLREYTETLYDVIEYAIDEYTLDKEYQEFIQLLRYFVSKKESALPLLHVLHIQDHQFLLFSQEGDRVTDDEIESYLKQWSEEKVTHDDIIVSTLIAMSPKRLIVHTDEPKHTVIHTLKNIFQHRMLICTGCIDCTQWKAEKNQLAHKTDNETSFNT